MVANRQERGCGRHNQECSCVDRISGRTYGRGRRTKSRSNTSVVPVSYSFHTKVIMAVLDRQRSGFKARIWWYCHDHDRSGRSAMIGNIGKEWSAQCDLGFRQVWRVFCVFNLELTLCLSSGSGVCNIMFSYTLSREYQVVRNRYSWVLFTRKDRLWANLLMQE